MDTAAIHTSLKLAGLEDPEIFEAVRFRVVNGEILQL